MKTNILTLAITLVVGVILLGSLLAPTISEAQKTAGDPIEKSNRAYDAYYCEMEEGDTYSISVDGITWNTTELGTPSARPVIVGEALCAQVFNTSAVNYLYITMNDGTAYAAVNAGPNTITFGNGQVTLEITTSGGLQTKTLACSWAYGLCDLENATYTLNDTRVQTSSYILNKDQIVAAAYRAGTTNAFYSYHNQELVSGTSQTTAVTNTELVEGTTDIYSAQLAFTIGSDSFTPEIILVPLKVVGHSTSGGVYGLYGAIVIITAVALVIFAVGAIRKE